MQKNKSKLGLIKPQYHYFLGLARGVGVDSLMSS
jgi:hypothetical protein